MSYPSKQFPLIHTVGDSHSKYAWTGIPGVTNTYLGPTLMYHFGSYRRYVTKDIPMDSIVCFSWGEIDCRCHVGKYPPYQLTIDMLVHNYFRTIESNVNGRNPSLIWIYNVVPPIRNPIETLDFPFIGSLEERVEYVRYMNEQLSQTKYTFVDLRNKYAGPDGVMKEGIHDNHVHVTTSIFIKEWIDKQIEGIK